MRIWVPAKAEYAVRAATRLAAGGDRLVKAKAIAGAERIPLRFLLTILREMVVAGLVESHRGMEGGFRLVRREPPVTVADVLRAVDHVLDPPLPRHVPSSFDAMVDRLRSDVWGSLDRVTIEDLARGERGPLAPAGV
jgi:Rrf2 family protein